MDRFIAGFEGVGDRDLMLCLRNGVAYQMDRRSLARYDDAYLEKFEAYDPAVADAVNAGRCAMLSRHLPAGAAVLDIGAGDGRFVRAARAAGFKAFGAEIIPRATQALRDAGLYADAGMPCDAVTLWDVIEHLEEPAQYLDAPLLFASIPVFDDLRDIRDSKHYRPGEHLVYWTAGGFIDWMAMRGFRLIERSDHETAAGRDSIGAFAFRRSPA
jgi:hypothetical protein